jgi:hypothetical protein
MIRIRSRVDVEELLRRAADPTPGTTTAELLAIPLPQTK